MLHRTLTRKTSFPHERGRSSRPEVFCKKGVLRNFAKFTGKHLCQILFFNKVAGPCRTPPVAASVYMIDYFNLQ